MKTLNSMKKGEQGVIRSLNGGRHFVKRVSSMGIIPETEVTMVSSSRRGAVIVHVCDTHIALGQGEAEKISIDEIERS